jgi:hypothetical protein
LESGGMVAVGVCDLGLAGGCEVVEVWRDGD